MSHFFGMLICLHLGVNNRYGDHAARALSRDGALLSELRGQHHHCQLARGHPSPLFRRCRPRRRPCSQEHLHSLGQYFEMQPCRRSCSHGDVVQEAWFCLGCRRLGPPLRRSNLEPVILQDPGFIAALSNIFFACGGHILHHGWCTARMQQRARSRRPGPRAAWLGRGLFGVPHHPPQGQKVRSRD